MSETLTAPVIDPSEFSPEELDDIRERERAIDEQLDAFLATGVETEAAFRGITESLERQAVANPKTFLAAREKLSTLTDEEDPTDDQLDKEDILKDVIDGPLRVQAITKHGIFAPPTPEVRTKVERAIAAVRDAESVEGKSARARTTQIANGANTEAYVTTQRSLRDAEETIADKLEAGEEPTPQELQRVKDLRFTASHLRKGMDIQSRNTGHTEKELALVDKWIAKMRKHNPDISDDDPFLKDALEQRAQAQADLEKVQSMVKPTVGARERLRNLLKAHPEGIEVVHELETTHDKHATDEDAQKALFKAREKHEKAQAKVAEYSSDPTHARYAIAQIDEYTARQAYEKATRHVDADTKNADLLTELADENALDKIALEDHEAAFGKLTDLENAATESLLEWRKSKRPIDEHGSYVAIKQMETYLAALDEKIVLARTDDRFLPHYHLLRNRALDSYLQVQYSKEIVRTEMFANAGDFEGRYSLAHDPDKGILIERGDGDFIIYPDGSYSSVYPALAEDGVTPLLDAKGDPITHQTPRMNAYGELVTTPVLEQIADPRALVDSAMVRAWESMTTENLQSVDGILYKKWIENPASPMARAQLEVISGILRERTADDGTAQAMEATYIERYLGVGREGTTDRLLSDGSVFAHMTLYGIEGNWVIHANGAADFYTPGTSEPLSRYAPDGTLVNAYGPEEGPSTPPTPEDDDETDDGSGGGTGGAPSTPPSTPSPSVPVAPAAPRPTPPVAARPGTVGGVRRPGFLASPEANTDDDTEDEADAPGSVSAAGAAPTPPTPPTPEAEPNAPKAPSVKEREAREARKQAVAAAKNNTIIMTSIAPKPGEIAPRGEYEQGSAYVPILGRTVFGDGANHRTEFRAEEEPWNEDEAVAKQISPETFYVGPVSMVEPLRGSNEYAPKIQTVTLPDGSEEELYRLQYRFDAEKAGVKYPTAGNNDYPENNILVVDTVLPKTAALGMLDAFAQNTASVRDFARDLYIANVENGTEIWDEQGGRPPYDKLPSDWKISFVMPDLTDEGVIVGNRLVRR